MLFQSTVGIISLIFIKFFQNAESFQSDVCQFVQDKPVPYQTLTPINVNTKTAIPINATSPLIIKNGLLGPLLIKNTGYAIEIYGHPTVYTTSGSYGGVLCGEFYKFHKLRIYFNRNPKGGSYGQLNGVDSFLTLNILYFKYSTFEESLHHRDGVANEVFHYKLGEAINPLFIPVAPAIRLLRKAGTAFYANEALLYGWFVRIPIIHKYYAFYGSYEDLETGKQYQCTINIVTDGIFSVFTKKQFEESFLKLENINGSMLETVSPIHKKAEKNQIYYAYGVNGQFVPI